MQCRLVQPGPGMLLSVGDPCAVSRFVDRERSELPLFCDELDPVPPRVENVGASCSRQLNVLANDDAGFLQTRQHFRIVAAAQGGMCLGRRMKILIHAKVNLDCAALEPAPAAFREFLRLGDFHHTKQVPKEFPCCFFFASRHGQLDVINCGEGTVVHVQIVPRSKGAAATWGSMATIPTVSSYGTYRLGEGVINVSTFTVATQRPSPRGTDGCDGENKNRRGNRRVWW